MSLLRYIWILSNSRDRTLVDRKFSFVLCSVSLLHQHKQTFAHTHALTPNRTNRQTNKQCTRAIFATSETLKLGSPPGLARFRSFVPIWCHKLVARHTRTMACDARVNSMNYTMNWRYPLRLRLIM